MFKNGVAKAKLGLNINSSDANRYPLEVITMGVSRW